VTRDGLNLLVLLMASAGLATGLALYLTEREDAADVAWAITTIVALLPLGITVLRDLLGGKAGVDIIALLAMAAALALGEYAAGAVIALMLSGGQVLEDRASRRARRELTSLLQRAPRVVHRYSDGGTISSPSIDDVRPGDRLLVKPGEVIPVDGSVEGETAIVDESALTGEAAPVERAAGDPVRSGTVNAAGTPFRMVARATAEQSTYAGIVRLVKEAQAQKAPLVRLADRYAVLFLPLSLAVAALAWMLSGDPVRALAVLVVATPCPLILAAPVAVVAGISRAARRGVIVKGGGALETLAQGRNLILDKTGTLTQGAPVVTDVEVFAEQSAEELLRLAASLDLVSPHVLAAAIVREARSRGLALTYPQKVHETLGSGIRGSVDGHEVALGRLEWVTDDHAVPQVRKVRRRTLLEGSSSVFVAIDGQLAGAIILEDPIRSDAPLTIRALRRTGFEKITMLSGDHADLAEAVGISLGVDLVYSERTPEDKVDIVRAARSEGITVMVGDGINDAPSLAAADVGVAMGARGASASSEAADVVLIVDRLDRLIEATRIARRSRAIALQSILAGMGLSVVAMVFAALGYLTPVVGALLQEAIDVAVILNALRALGDRRGRRGSPAAVRVGMQIREEHREFMPEVQRIRQVADRLEQMDPQTAREELEKIHRFLVDELIPHEAEEDASVYPAIAEIIGGDDPTAAMTRAHQEINHRIRIFGRLLEEIPEEGPGPEDIAELRRILYGLHAILHLHFKQEEEAYLALIAQRGEDGG
jgi:heavy metal translocating P-type ATPase